MIKYRIQSLAYEDMFTELSCPLETVKTVARWNYQRGYKIVDVETKEVVDQREHICPQCRKCSVCSHIFSEHDGEDSGPKKCIAKKCKCKEFKYNG